MDVNTLILGRKGIGRWKSWYMQAFLQGRLLNESLNRSGSQDMRRSSILAEEDFMRYFLSFLSSASPHHSIGYKRGIQAWLERAWGTGTAWPFLLITKYATSHNCEPHCPCTSMPSKYFWAVESNSSCQWLPTNGTGCSHTVFCVLTELLFTQWYYTLDCSPSPPSSLSSCMSVSPSFHKSKWVTKVCNLLLFTTSLIKGCFPVVLAVLWGFSHSTAVCSRIQNWGGLCHHMDTTPIIQGTCSHAQGQNHPKDLLISRRRWLHPCAPECFWDCLLTLS